jgi:heme-degrading monooxygenase HmoA
MQANSGWQSAVVLSRRVLATKEDSMVMTVLEAHVARHRVEDLERAWQEAAMALPPGLVESFLGRDARDETLYRIVTIWASREVLEEMRAAVEKPKGVQMFEAAGATPTLSVLDVVVHAQR